MSAGDRERDRERDRDRDRDRDRVWGPERVPGPGDWDRMLATSLACS